MGIFSLAAFVMNKLQYSIQKAIFQFKQPAGTSRGVYTTRTSWLVSLFHSDQPHIVGRGECAPLPALSCDDVADYEHILHRFAAQLCQDNTLNLDSISAYPSICFGLETALQDLRNGGKGILYDTAFTRGEEGITINGLVWMGNVEEMRQRIEEKLAQGFGCVKLKVGAIDFDSELYLIQMIRKRFSPQTITLRLDANGGFSNDTALHKLMRLAPYSIHSIEQPIAQKQWQQMAELCRQTPIPIALDEELIGVNKFEDKQQLLKTIQPQYIILKPSLHGGIQGTQEWINLAEENHISSWITSALESNIGLNAIAQMAAHFYPDINRMPQGLGTGMLYTNNIPSPLIIKGEKLWRQNHDC